MTRRYSTSILPASAQFSGIKIFREKVKNVALSHVKARSAIAWQAAVDSVAVAVHHESCREIDLKNS